MVKLVKNCSKLELHFSATFLLQQKKSQLVNEMAESMIYVPSSNSLRILNQLLLPLSVKYEEIKNAEDAWNAIKQMKVRGAPAIAILGLLSVAVELGNESIVKELAGDTTKVKHFLKTKADYLCTSRPTAVNIHKEFTALLALVEDLISRKQKTGTQLIAFVRNHCFKALEIDIQTNKRIGDFGAEHIVQSASKKGRSKVNVLTHCNTGSLATAGYGTALGVIRSLHNRGQLERAYCTETRPYNQGARLTAWELFTDAIPSTLLCDNMVASLMASRQIDAVVVGADRVVANGDTANKIGTFQIAILCQHFGVPFYVASPYSTLDLTKKDGSLIPIEERPENEMRFVGNVQIAPAEMPCYNPSFDVTPASLITGGIITEEGVVPPSELLSRFNN